MLEYMRSLPRPATFREEIKSFQFWKSVRTELLCATLFVVVIQGATLDVRQLPPRVDQLTLSLLELKLALCYLCIVSTLMYISSGHFSSKAAMPVYEACHLSPHISFSMVLVREMSMLRFVAYFMAQIIGALLGCAILFGLTCYDATGKIGLNYLEPLENLPPANMFGVEFIAAFLITLAYLKATDDNGLCYARARAQYEQQNGTATNANGTVGSSIGHRLIETNGTANISANISENSTRLAFVGLATAGAHFFSFRFTGSGLNPARAFALALFANKWNHHWIFWVSPMLGSALASFTYEYVRSSKIKTTNIGGVDSTANVRPNDRHVLSMSSIGRVVLTDQENVTFNSEEVTQMTSAERY